MEAYFPVWNNTEKTTIISLVSIFCIKARSVAATKLFIQAKSPGAVQQPPAPRRWFLWAQSRPGKDCLPCAAFDLLCWVALRLYYNFLNFDSSRNQI